MEKAYCQILNQIFFLWLVKSLKNLCIIGLLITSRNVFFLQIFSLVSGLLDKLQMLKIQSLLQV